MLNLVSPSILSCDFLNIETELSYFSGSKNLWIHLDIMDGHFVPNLTFGIPIIEQISKKTSLPLDAHLMVSNPEFHIQQMKGFGLENITFHLEAVADAKGLLNTAKKHYKSVGVSIKPGTEISTIDLEVLKVCDLILVMSVEPGFGGQSFIEDSYKKISELVELKEKHNLSFQIQVDGGVSNINSKQLRKAGAENLVAGSYIFKKNPSEYGALVESLR